MNRPIVGAEWTAYVIKRLFHFTLGYSLKNKEYNYELINFDNYQHI